MTEPETLYCSRESGPMERPEFSVVITCYYEERSIDEFYSRLSKTLESLGRSYEIMFVNDGSTDQTLRKLKYIFDNDDKVTTVIDLFRNVGQASAVTAGIAHAHGTHIILMDSDLQLSPEELPLLVEEFDKGYDIVSGFRKNRKDPLLRRLPSKLANVIMRRVAKHSVCDFGCTFKIYDGRLIRAFRFGQYKRFHTAFVYSKAQRCSEVAVTHSARKYGKSGWTLGSLISYLMENVVGFSQRPFQILSLLCGVAAVIFIARVILGWFVPFGVLPEVTPGLVLNVIIIHLLITLATLAAIGEYVIRNFNYLQDYPIYTIREIRTKYPAAGRV